MCDSFRDDYHMMILYVQKKHMLIEHMRLHVVLEPSLHALIFFSFFTKKATFHGSTAHF